MGGLKRFLTGIFLGANLGTILILWICCLSTWVSPEYHPLVSLIGLVFPIILLVNILFCLFWLIFKARLIWVPVVGMLAVSSYIYDFIPFNWRSEQPQDALKVISFNVGGMTEEDQRLQLVEFVKEMGADIFCMQEVHGNWMGRADVKAMLDSMQYRCLKGSGECIITRLPVVGDTIHISYPTRKNNSSLGCRLIYQDDTILVVNNHLESNALSDDDKSEFKEMMKDPQKEKVKKGSRNLAGKLGDAATYRGPQADSLVALVKAYGDRNVILCGDFNDTPISYTYQRLARSMKSAYRDSGSGMGISFNQRGFPVRIDHIFMTKEWESSQTRIISRLDISDHYPIVTYLHKKRQ
jgi:endonuclease/exonuclease/phosphatase family metal-dependent hydrolase